MEIYWRGYVGMCTATQGWNEKSAMRRKTPV